MNENSLTSIKSILLEKILLEKISLGFQTAFTPNILHHPDVSIMYDHCVDMVVASFRASLLVYKQDPVEIKFPRDWWQAFRERWLPKWWLKRWPVVYEVRKIHLFNAFAGLSVPKGVDVYPIAVQDVPKYWSPS